LRFPLDLRDISLWLAITSIILIIAYELTSVRYRRTVLMIRRRYLEKIALLFSLLFLLTVFLRALELL
jgi:hypothetical protein